MKRHTGLWSLVGFAVSSLFGTILHFLYEWLGEPRWIAPFSGINESTWEHMKLLFWPMLIFAAVQAFFFRGERAFICIKLRGILLGISLIPIIFYTYNGVIGSSPDWINITIFFVSAAAAYIYEAALFKKGTAECRHPIAAALSLGIIAVMFVIFTFYPPGLAIFMDP
ncbi:MAG: hypothetical protein E7617_04460 [Ruminococcaceae bacterium]|nr:hypothetical protein [Oscillospiraceae bacterium]